MKDNILRFVKDDKLFIYSFNDWNMYFDKSYDTDYRLMRVIEEMVRRYYHCNNYLTIDYITRLYKEKIKDKIEYKQLKDVINGDLNEYLFSDILSSEDLQGNISESIQ